MLSAFILFKDYWKRQRFSSPTPHKNIKKAIDKDALARNVLGAKGEIGK